MTIGRWGRALLVTLSAVVLSAVPATAQVKVRFQTWHWNENPWVKALEEFQKGFNAASPGIQVVRDDSRYADKEAVFITQSQAKAAADIAHFSYRAVRHLADRGFLMDLSPFVEKEGGEKSNSLLHRLPSPQSSDHALVPGPSWRCRLAPRSEAAGPRNR